MIIIEIISQHVNRARAPPSLHVFTETTVP
jgi:hypothetical protein